MTALVFQIGFIALVILAYASYKTGERKAVALASAPHQSHFEFHSLPGYHGAWVAILTIMPALIVFLLWAIFGAAIEKSYVLSQHATQLEGLGDAQRDGVWRNVLSAMAGSATGTIDPLVQSMASSLSTIKLIANVLIAVILATLLTVGYTYSSRMITPAFRARHRVERFVKVLLFIASGVAILTTIGIILSLITETLRFFQSVNVLNFLFGLEWTPQQMAFRADQAGGSAAFGIVPLLTGTLLITVIAMSVAAPIGLLSAVYLSDYASPRVRAIGKPMLEVLAGIPTVVYGFFAALTVAPFIRDVGMSLNLNVASESALAAGLVMGIMIVPFVSSLSDDVINAVPQSLRDGSYALGATKSETILKVVLPAALPGIVSALILAVSRAIGETMIVVMAAGLTANLTFNPLDAVTTVTVQIGTLLTGDQEFDSPKTLAAFALGLTLFVITLILNLIALRVVKKYREQYD
jgi:phosphate transport system permease protein